MDFHLDKKRKRGIVALGSLIGLLFFIGGSILLASPGRDMNAQQVSEVKVTYFDGKEETLHLKGSVRLERGGNLMQYCDNIEIVAACYVEKCALMDVKTYKTK